MKHTIHAVLAIICLVVIRAAYAEPTITPGELQTRIARVSFKVDQASGAYLYLIAPRQDRYFVASPGAKPPIPETTRLFQQLYTKASITKKLSAAVCTEEVVKPLCGPKFDPAWLSDPNSMTPTLESLSMWITETDTAIEPLHKGLCDMAVAKSGNKVTCPARLERL